MGNCCASPAAPFKKGANQKKQNKPNPYSVDYNRTPNPGIGKLAVLRDPTGHDIDGRFELGQELGRGEFGITYLCTDRATGEAFACKSISKKKLRTAVDIEDVRREVDIMRHLPPHPNLVGLKGAYEDDSAVHLVMELCEGGELFDRIVARGHYTERAAAAITKTIIEVVQVWPLLCSFYNSTNSGGICWVLVSGVDRILCSGDLVTILLRVLCVEMYQHYCC